MLHFSVEDGYTLNGTSEIDGIHCNKFVSMEVKVPAINGSFHVEYHWTGNKYMHNWGQSLHKRQVVESFLDYLYNVLGKVSRYRFD